MRAPQVHVCPTPGSPFGLRWRVVVDGRRMGHRVLAASCEALVRAQVDAISCARAIAIRLRAELVVHGADGRIRRKDSFGRDPRRSRG